MVSIIIPAFNEEDSIADCIKSLKKQTYQPFEIIIIDDGSRDQTALIAKQLGAKILKQDHQGPGVARNLGAENAKGEILVFVDADMTFDNNFVKDLIKPIAKGNSVGTFSKNEINANADKLLSKYWNINRGWPIKKLIPKNYPDTSPVYRAIKKTEFNKVDGFDTTGEYTDDWSLSRKLGLKAKLAKGAIYYHKNPEKPVEVWKQARWIGKNSFISGSFPRKIKSLIFYSFPISLIIGVYKSAVKLNGDPHFVAFRISYDFAIWVSVIESFFKIKKYK